MSRKKRKKSKLKIFVILILAVIAGIFWGYQNRGVVVCIDAGHGGTDARLDCK